MSRWIVIGIYTQIQISNFLSLYISHTVKVTVLYHPIYYLLLTNLPNIFDSKAIYSEDR